MSELTFEQALKQLEDITKQLESGTLTLDDSMKAYEQAVKLSDFCSKKLTQAELQIKNLDEKDSGEED